MKNKMLAILLLCYCHGALAQQQTDTAFVHPKNFILDEMVVSANRWEQNLREVPSRVAKVNASLIAFQNPQTAADLLTLSNQVFVQKSQMGGGSPMIRGFSTNRVLLVVDGVRMNNAIFRSGNVQNVISLDANAVEDSEVIFGPGSVMYGSDAIGGVMDFHTLRPTLAKDETLNFHANALTRYSSANNERTVHSNFNIGLKKWAFRTSVTRAVYDDLRMGSDGPVEYTRPSLQGRENGVDVEIPNANPNVQAPTGFNQWNFMQKVLFQPNDQWQVSYGFHFSETSSYARYDRLILRGPENFVSAEWYYGPQKWIMHALSIHHYAPMRAADHIRFTAGLQHYEESRHNRNFGDVRRTNRFESVDALSFNLDLDKQVTNNLTLFYGGEFITNTVGSSAFRNHVDTGEITPVSTRYPDGAIWRSGAVYASLKYAFHEHWILTASGRVSDVYTRAQFDRTFFNFPFESATLRNRAANGSLGLIYNARENVKLYVNASNGFRAPNVDDIGKVFDSQPGNVVVPNPDLKPEQAYSVETGIATIIADKLKVDGAVYYTYLDNAIIRGPSLFNGQDSIDFDGIRSRVLALQNTSNVQVYGFQVNAEWRLSRDITATSSLNVQRGQERDPESGIVYSPTHIPPTFGATHIIYQRGKLKADVYAQYNGTIGFDRLAITERADSHLYAPDENGNPFSPSWWTLNAKSSYAFHDRISLDIGVENMLDKRYRPYSSGLVAPGINVIVALRANF